MTTFYSKLTIVILVSKNRKFLVIKIIGVALFVQSITYQIIYSIGFSVFVLFAKHNLDLNFLFFTLTPVSILTFQPFWCVVLSLVISTLYNRLSKKGINVSIPANQYIGLLFVFLGFVALVIPCYLFATNGYISSYWVFLYFAFATVGEILILALGLSIAMKYFPTSILSLVSGVWLLTSGVGSALAGKVAVFVAIPDSIGISAVETLPIYTNFFMVLLVVALVAGIIYFLTNKYYHKVAKKHGFDVF